jgi:DNA-binding NarL/FixJ family response regulator
VSAEPPFAEWAGRVTGCVLRELAPHLGRALLVTTQPNRAGLPPRSLEVLDTLLDGDAEKQVALRLGIGRDTVHDHVKLLYRHFGVCSRAELLAYFLRRYRGHPGGHGERPA